MPNHIDALIGRAPIAENIIHEYGLAVAYENGYAIIFLDEDHIYYWSNQLNLGIESKSRNVDWDCELTHFWSRELGFSKFAIIHTDYFAGIGEQSACLYSADIKIMDDVSINEVLEELGVPNTLNLDAFDNIKLSDYRFTEQYYWSTCNQAIGKENMIAGKPYGR